jgi:hypothetical protein
LLQCTDLDGTLIEDGEEGDWVRQNDELTYLASQHFAQYLAPAGGLIVYNTGRSIGEAGGGGGRGGNWAVVKEAQAAACKIPDPMLLMIVEYA